MTRRTDSSNAGACVLVLNRLVDYVRSNALASGVVASQAELKHLLQAGNMALAGLELVRMRCISAPCKWEGLFPLATPSAFVCCRCKRIAGEVVP